MRRSNFSAWTMWGGLGGILCLGLAIILTQRTSVAQPPAEQPAPLAQQLEHAALAGKLQQVADTLKAQTTLLAQDAQATALMTDLQQFQVHSRQLARQQVKDLLSAQDRLHTAQAANKIDEAMVALLEAHALVDDPATLLADASVRDLLNQTQQQASAAETAGDWLEALSLYREMDLLYEAGSPYRKIIRSTERRVSMLRLYAPQELKRLINQRSQRLVADTQPAATQPADPILGNETWEKKLAGVDLATLQLAFKEAAQRHVGNGGYKPLLLGALDDLNVLAGTPALAETFPVLKEQSKTADFQKTLASLRQDISGIAEPDSMDASRLIDNIVEANRATLNLPESVLAYEMSEGAMGSLDEFSNLLWPYEKEELMKTTQGSFFGVGILLSQRRDHEATWLTVVSPLRNSPALKAGIRADDLIVSVDGKSTKGWSTDQAAHIIQGKENTDVVLGIERAGQAEPILFTLKRARIPIDSVRGWQYKPDGSWDWDFLLDPVARIAYVRITSFSRETSTNLDLALNQVQSTGELNGVILDLRYDPGGLLPEAIQVANRFIREGVLVSTVDGRGKVHDEWRARPERTHGDFPLIVLVNDGSASASEIVSGALQDHGRALILGTRSYGKGSVQDVIPLPPRAIDPIAFLKLTTQYYRLPKGRIIHRLPDSKTWGIEPDVLVKITPQQADLAMRTRQDADIIRAPDAPPATQPVATAQSILEKGLDPQLETALMILKTQWFAQRIDQTMQAAMPPAPANTP